MAGLSIENLRKSFGSVEVLKGINLEIEDGGFLVLVGPSGCGKSTLLNTIAGLEEINSGDVKIGGVSVNGLHPSKRDIAMVFQSYALYPNMNVAKNISFGMEIRGVGKPEINKAIHEVASLLQIEELLTRKPSQLSGGQRQRVAMGRALVRNPQVYLFDEPLSNLDAKLRVDMRTEIKRIHQRLKTTIVYVTHDQIEALTLATKIAVLKDGTLQQAGSPDEIYNNPENIFVADFMGSPSMNLMKARVEKKKKGVQVIIENTGAAEIFLPVEGVHGLDNYDGQEVVFGIRPEALTDTESADKSSGSKIIPKPVLIEVVEPAGSDTFAVSHIGGIQAVARLRADTKVQAGNVIKLAFNMSKTVFFDVKTEQRIR